MKFSLKAQRLFLPKIQDILFIAIFLGVIGLGSRLLNVDGDLGRHLTIGRYILSSFSIPIQDIFSHTLEGQALTPHEWLSQVIFAAAFMLDGLDGVVLLVAIVLAFTFTLTFKLCLHRTNLVLLSLGWTILAAATASLHWLARPHIFTLLFVVLWIGMLEKIRRGEDKRWWVLPLVMLFWANMHGAFIAGFVIWGMYFVGEIWDHLTRSEQETRSAKWVEKWLLIGGSSFLATLINPVGLRLWETSVGFIRNRYLVSHTAEYMPPNFHDVSTWPFLLMIGLSVLVLARSRLRLGGAHILVVIGWTLMGLYSVRNVPIYAIVSSPILAESSAQLIKHKNWSKGYINIEGRLSRIEDELIGKFWPLVVVIVVTFGMVSGLVLDFARVGNRFDPQVFPVDAVDHIESDLPEGNVFNYFPWGGYLLYRLWPDRGVFIDGQTDFYGEDLTRQYEQVITMQTGWQEVLDQYDVQWVIMPKESELAKVLMNDPDWETSYQDTVTAILIQK